MKLIVVKKKSPKRITGTACNSASCLEIEKNVDTIRTPIKRRTGILRGFISIVTFFSTIVLIHQMIRRARDAKTISICFGNVKKSVVIVRKKIGKSKKTAAVKIVATDVK